MGAGARQTWSVTIDGSPEIVELVPYAGRLWGMPGSFRVRELEATFAWPAGLSRWRRATTPRAGSIDVGGLHLTMTLTAVSLAYRAALRRNLGGATRSGPLAFLGTIIGGAGMGGGAAAAAQTTLAWVIYELAVDGNPSGSWVAETIDGQVTRWTWVRPGDPLPDRETTQFGR